MEKVEVEKVEEEAVEVSLEEDGVVIDELVALCIDVDAIHGQILQKRTPPAHPGS